MQGKFKYLIEDIYFKIKFLPSIHQVDIQFCCDYNLNVHNFKKFSIFIKLY